MRINIKSDARRIAEARAGPKGHRGPLHNQFMKNSFVKNADSTFYHGYCTHRLTCTSRDDGISTLVKSKARITDPSEVMISDRAMMDYLGTDSTEYQNSVQHQRYLENYHVDQ